MERCRPPTSATWLKKAHVLQLLMVIRLIHGFLVLSRYVAPQRPIAGNAHTMVMTLFRSQWMMVQTACVCGTSCLTSTCSIVGSTNNGSTTENTLPSPGTLCTSMCPACRSTSFQAMYNPNPKPGCAPVCTSTPGTREYDSKMCGSSSAGIPTPTSRTEMLASNPAWCKLTVIGSPFGEYLCAFESKLSRT